MVDLVGLGGMINFEIGRVWTNFRESQPLHACLRTSQMQWILPRGLLFTLQPFPQATSQEFLATKEFLSEGQRELSRHHQNHDPSKSGTPQVAHDLPPIPGCPAVLPWAPTSFSSIRCAAAPFSATLDSGIWTSVITPWAVWVWGSMCPFSLRAKKSSGSHLTNKGFVQTLSKQF